MATNKSGRGLLYGTVAFAKEEQGRDVTRGASRGPLKLRAPRPIRLSANASWTARGYISARGWRRVLVCVNPAAAEQEHVY